MRKSLVGIVGIATLLCAVAIVLFLFMPGVNHARSWPAKPITIVVGGPAGGTADTLARLMSEHLAKSLGQPVVVEPRPGAAGVISVHALLSAPHDGHTILLTQKGIVSETPLAVKVNYQPFNDLKPIIQVAQTSLMLVGNIDLPDKTLKALIANIKNHPGKFNYASYATGMRGHTMGIQLNQLAGIDMGHVGYKGSPPALQDVMGGHVPLAFDGAATSIPLVKAGKLRAYAIASASRMAALPDVPTFAELGFPEIAKASWMALWTPPDVPADVQGKIRDAATEVVNNEHYRERVLALGMEPGKPLSSEALVKDARESFDEQAALLKSIGFSTGAGSN